MKYITTTVRGLPSGTTKRDIEHNFNQSLDLESPCLAGPVVDELQSNTRSTTVTFRSEKHGRNCDEIKEYFNGSHFRGQNATISVTDDFLGLTPLAGQADAPVHVYFVHGLGGHAFKTWSSDVRNNNIESLRAWPRDFLPNRLLAEEIQARIYTLGFNANMMRNAAPDAIVNSAAEDMLGSLYGDRSANHPREIYFVCHSLGGLVVCQALVMALFQDEGYRNKPEYRGLFVRNGECLVKGITFMGTPFRGSGHAALFSPFVRAVRQLNMVSAVNDSFIKSLNDKQPVDITNIIHRFHGIMNQNGIRVLVCCEETPIAGSSLITTYQSAMATFGDSAIPIRIHKDHRQMVKFDDQNNGDYKNLENNIVKLIRPPTRHDPSSADTLSPAMRPISGATYSPGFGSQHPYRERESGMTGPNSTAPAPSQTIYYNNYFGDQSGVRPQSRGYGGPDQSGSRNNPQAGYERLVAGQIDMSGKLPSRQQTLPHSNGKHPRPAPQPSSQVNSDPNVNLANGFGSTHLGPHTTRRSTTPVAQSANDDDDLFNRLIMFDTVFIVDDTGSMILPAKDSHDTGPDRWSTTMDALWHIAHLAARKDPDGIDIRFLKAESLNKDNITSGETVMEILGLVDMYDGTHGGGTVFRDHLEDAISPRMTSYRDYKHAKDSYEESLRALAGDRRARAQLIKPRPPKKLNLIVITDGKADDKQEVEEYIINIARELDTLDAPTAQIGIQFVQIGEDEHAKTFLTRLDNDLKHEIPPIRDIVDTTPFDSAYTQESQDFQHVLEQVLLGAITKDIDDRNTPKPPS